MKRLFAVLTIVSCCALQADSLSDLRDFDLHADARALFENVAHAYGLDCVFEDEFTTEGKPVRFQIQQVDYRTAMHALEMATGSFAVPLSPKVFLVAKDTPEKRRALEPYTAITIDISQAAAQQELAEYVQGVQQVLGIEKLALQVQGSRVMLRGPASKIVAASQLLEELIQQRKQVLIEVKLLEVSRNDALTYGLDFPTIFPIQSFDSLAKAGTTLLKVAKDGLAKWAFAPAVITDTLVAKMEESSGHSLLDFAIRSSNHQAAVFHAGDRYPIVTQEFVSGQPATSNSSSDGDASATPAVFGKVSHPSAVVAGDFNHDGVPDVAAASVGSDAVAVLMGNQDGSFQDAALFATGKSPSAIAAIDVDVDGVLDLVTADSESGTVSVLLGKGDGTFQPAKQYAVGERPVALAIGDFNGDKLLDIATANAGSDSISILLGRKDGTFAGQQVWAAGSGPQALVAVDLNGDGKLDLAVVEMNSDEVSILLGIGDGTFRDAAKYPTGKSPAAIAGADLNLDGKMDLVVANSADDTVSFFAGDGTGALRKGVAFPAGEGPVALAIADFNADGAKDVAVANPDDGAVSLLFGSGNGSFQAPVAFDTGTHPDALTTADVNQDGVADLVAANSASDSVSLLLGVSGGGFRDSSGKSITATGGQTFAPTPTFSYEDLGLVVKATPHVQAMNEVAVDLDFEYKLLTGQARAKLPVIAHRKLTTQIRAANGEWVAIAGLLSESDARTITGVPIAFLQERQRDREKSEVLILIKTSLVSAPSREIPSAPIALGSETRPRLPL